jgi:hypothetical protein
MISHMNIFFIFLNLNFVINKFCRVMIFMYYVIMKLI